MHKTFRISLLTAAGLFAAFGAAAQQAPQASGAAQAQPAPAGPVVRQVQAAPAASAQEPAREERFGDATRSLIGLQASGLRAGPGQPLQGPVASAAWKRYMKSFEHPIPQWFGDRVSTGGNGNAGAGLSR